MAAVLDQCVIALSGKFDLTHADLTKLIKNNGGKHTAKIADGVTHLVASEADIDKEAPKVKQAIDFPGIDIVSYDWLLSSINSKRKLDEAQFTMTTQNSLTSGPPIPAKGKGKKRAVSDTPVDREPSEDEEIEEQPPLKKFKETQVAKSSSLVVPVDEHCPLVGSYRVYIDDDGIIHDATLNQTSAGDNHNKFYRIQILYSASGNFQTWTRWGRVGATGSNSLLGNGSLGDAINHFNKKFREKSGNSWEDRLQPARTDRKKAFYTFIERQYEDESSDDEEAPDPSIKRNSKQDADPNPSKHVESLLPKPVQRLMELIFNKQFFEDTMRILDYDAEKLPLGQLSKRTLQQGFQALKELGELLSNPAIGDFVWTQRLEQRSNLYYTLIPHVFGRHAPPVIRSDEALRKEIGLLESLSDMEIATKIMKDEGSKTGETVHVLDKQFAALSLQEMTPLDATSKEFKLLQDYLVKSHGSTHHLSFKVQDIFRVERDGEADRCANLPGSDRRLLWHGSRVTNFGGILSQGLRIAPPEAPVSGYAFGKGVYLADTSSKSANYCYSYTSGDTGLLLLCEALLKTPNSKHMLELESGDSGAAELAKQQGSIATWGKGTTGPADWKDAKCVHKDLTGVIMPDTSKPPGPTNANGYLQYNEYIAYDVAQVKLRYLLRVEMK